MDKYFFKKKITQIIMFIPFAFRRYKITSILSVFAIGMTLLGLYSGSSNIQLLMKKEKKNPVEYQITIYPPNSVENNNDFWISEVKALLRQNKVESYSWIYKERTVIDVVNLFAGKADIHLIETILQKKGFLKDDVKIDLNTTENRFDTYDIEFELDDKSSSGKRAWSTDVEKLLLEKGYFASTDGCHNPVALNVNYPPFREAYTMIGFIKEKGLKGPSAFSIYKNCPPDGSAEDLFLDLEGSKDSIKISGFVPLKKYDPQFHHDNSTFTVNIVNPEGNVGVAKVTAHPVNGFILQYPQDFMPPNNSLLKGGYQLKCSINDQKAFDTKFELDKKNNVIWPQNKKPQRVFYSKVE